MVEETSYAKTLRHKIKNAEIAGDFFSFRDIKEFAATLNGVRFTKSDVLSAFKNVGDYVKGANAQEIVGELFS